MTLEASRSVDRRIGVAQPSAAPVDARVDLRMAPAAASVWLTAAVMVDVSRVGGRRERGPPQRRRLSGGPSRLPARPTVLLCLVVAVGGAAVCAFRVAANESGAVPALAREHAYVSFDLRVRDDPRASQGRFGSYVVLRGVMARVAGRGIISLVRSPVIVIGDPAWADVRWGQLVRGAGRLAPADGNDVAALVIASGPPRLVRAAGWVYQGADAYRAAIVASVSQLDRTSGLCFPRSSTATSRGSTRRCRTTSRRPD